MATLETKERNKLGLEDLLFSNTTETQSRDGSSVTITGINAANLPFSPLQTLEAKIASSVATKFAFVGLNARGHMISTYAEANLFSFSARGHLLVHYTPTNTN